MVRLVSHGTQQGSWLAIFVVGILCCEWVLALKIIPTPMLINAPTSIAATPSEVALGSVQSHPSWSASTPATLFQDGESDKDDLIMPEGQALQLHNLAHSLESSLVASTFASQQALPHFNPRTISLLQTAVDRILENEVIYPSALMVVRIIKKLLDNMTGGPNPMPPRPNPTTRTNTTTATGSVTITNTGTTTDTTTGSTPTTLPGPQPTVTVTTTKRMNTWPCSPCTTLHMNEVAGEAMTWTSGFLEVTRRAAGTANLPSTPTSAFDGREASISEKSSGSGGIQITERQLGTSDNLSLPKWRLTDHEKAYLFHTAKDEIHRALTKARFDDPNDPMWSIVTEPSCTKAFKLLYKAAVKWLGEHPSSGS